MNNLKISERLKQFLQQDSIQKLLDNYNFEQVYKALQTSLVAVSDVSTFTLMMYRIGITPLYYMQNIPPHFFTYEITPDSFVIPSTIIELKTACFYKCSNLKELILPPNIIKIQPYSIFDCRNLEGHIYYRGTKEEWDKVEKDPNDDILKTIQFIGD